MADSALRDRRILVVEDEYLIATTLSDQLEGVGSIVVGPVSSVEKAIKAIEFESGDRRGDLGRQPGRRIGLSRRRSASGAQHSIHLYFWL